MIPLRKCLGEKNVISRDLTLWVGGSLPQPARVKGEKKVHEKN